MAQPAIKMMVVISHIDYINYLISPVELNYRP